MEGFRRAMSAFAKALMVALIVLNLLLAWGPLLTAPDSILALHFRMGGAADNFGSTIVWGLSMTFACGIMLLAQMKAMLGSLDRVERIVKLGVFVNSTPDFTDQPKVANGASELMQDVFGENGRHARSAVGVAALPLGVAVEVDAVVAVRA